MMPWRHGSFLMLDAEIGFDARLIQPTANYFHLQHTDVKSMHS